MRDLEPALRDKLRKNFARGKLEISLNFRADVEQSQNFCVNNALVEQLGQALQQVQGTLGQSNSISPLEVLKWPGVLQTAEVDYAQVKALALQLFQQAIEQLQAMREQEGDALQQIVEQRLSRINEITAEIRSHLPNIMAQQKEKLQKRIDDAKAELEPGRLEQELVLLLQKADVDEELDRLQTHVSEVTRTLKQKNAIGRRLDFLMQELNREANTLSSKAIDTDVTQTAVELKVLIEQMREQIQNIE
ncbi:Protein YicC [gamma proteobacterium IMCC2047]|nr:Protein YicC [gamma proteobacterium IMCC2047]